MKTRFLLLTLCLCRCAYGQTNAPEPLNPIPIKGICFDLATAVYLPVEAFAGVGNAKVKVGQSDKDGKFSLLLPRSATSLTFESRGYRTLTLPVQIVGQPSAKAEFRLGIIMGTFDSLPVQQTHQLLLSHDLPDHADGTYFVGPIGSNAGLPMMQTAHGNRVPDGGYMKFGTGRRHQPIMNFEGARPGPYRIFVSTATGRVLVNEDITVGAGITLMEVRAKELIERAESVKPNEARKAEIATPDSQTLYFEQSQYELTSRTEAALDSIAQRLLTFPSIMVQLTGYTEDIGERKLNMTLSEYRAKKVANYLKQKGIPDSQITISWKGPESAGNSGHTKGEKGNNRQVTVEFSRR